MEAFFIILSIYALYKFTKYGYDLKKKIQIRSGYDIFSAMNFFISLSAIFSLFFWSVSSGMNSFVWLSCLLFLIYYMYSRNIKNMNSMDAAVSVLYQVTFVIAFLTFVLLIIAALSPRRSYGTGLAKPGIENVHKIKHWK
jgi:hypothetical protein